MMTTPLTERAVGLPFAEQQSKIRVDLDQSDGGFKARMSQKRLGDSRQRLVDGHLAQLMPQRLGREIVVAAVEQLVPM